MKHFFTLGTLFLLIFSQVQAQQPSNRTIPNITDWEQLQVQKEAQQYIRKEKKQSEKAKPVQTQTIHTQRGQTGPLNIKDSRNLPLNSDGKLLSPQGYIVDFDVPFNPQNPGICGTPTPAITSLPPNAKANCPFVVPCDDPLNRDANIPAPSDPFIYMKLNWVVIEDASGAGSNIDQARVDDLMAELNNDFQAARIQFCADPATFVTDLTHYNLNVGSEDASLKNTHGVSPNDYINVYVVNGISNPSAGGYARFPYDPFGGTNIRGGVVMSRNNSNVGTHTLAHELGHTFGLHHTFHGVDEVSPCTSCYEGRDLPSGASTDGDTEGDWCSDTNPHATNAYICGDQGNDACAPNLPWLNAPVDNHMSYSFCSSTFSSQQMGRMHCMISTYLGSWTAFGGGTCGSLPPVANFIGTPTLYQAPGDVDFTDASTPASVISTWTWDFDVAGAGGVTPATFVGQTPPTVTYANPGMYTVSLTVSNANGTDTETKTDYIEMLTPASDCDTLDTQWLTPTPTPSVFTYAAGNYVTGVPNSFGDFAYMQSFFTPNPGTSTVGAARIGIGNYLDADSSMRFDVVVYEATGTGAPDLVTGPIGGLGNINPGALAVPAGFNFLEYWIPFFNPATITGTEFFVSVVIYNNDPTDQLLVVCTDNGEGQNLGLSYGLSNILAPTSFNYLSDVGLDADLNIVPMMGEWPADPFVLLFAEAIGCDTTVGLFVDTMLYNSTMTSATVAFSNGNSLTVTDPADIDSILFFWEVPPIDSFTISTINECGRENEVEYFINYSYNESPTPDFSITQANPVCIGSTVDFTADPVPGPTIGDYLWDFGDGTTSSGGTANTITHTYASPGLYYVTLVVTDTAGCTGEIQKLDIVEVVDCAVAAPVAAFSTNPITACQGANISFIDASTNSPTGWLWDFGDGSYSLSQNTLHSYTLPGTYNVILTTTNAGGTDMLALSVVINDCPFALEFPLQAVPNQSHVDLFWVSELGSGGTFELQRRDLTQGFTTINTQLSSSERNYQYRDVDALLLNRPLHYRVRMTDADGMVELSEEVAVYPNGNTDWVKAYPNPLPDGQRMQIFTYLEESGNIQYQLLDMNGRVAWQSNDTHPGGWINQTVDVSSIAKGMYLLKVKDARGHTKVIKYVIE